MKNIISGAKIVVPLLAAVLLMYFVFRNVDFALFWENLSDVNYYWVVFSIILSTIAYLARAYRWQLLLEPLGFRIDLYRPTLIIIIGYLINLGLPRVGEIARCGLLKRTAQVPVNVSLGTVITERVLDMMMLLLLFILALLAEYDVLMNFLLETLDIDYNALIWSFAVLAAVGGSAAFAIYFLFKFKKLERVTTFLLGIKDGILSIAKVRNVWGVVISSMVLWLVYFLMSYTIIFSLSATAHLQLTSGLLLLVVGGIAISLPVQSGFGTYHAMIAGLLVIYGIEKTTGLFLATLLHTSQVVAIAIFGVLALILLSVANKKHAVNSK